MKVIFLDIDGVLNNNEHVSLLSRVLGFNQCKALYNVIGELPFDEECCALMRELIRQTEAKVVLSSTWRLNDKSNELIKEYAGIEIYDKTPRKPYEIRGVEIQEYLDTHKNITNYVIIDDDRDMLESQNLNFVPVSNLVGFTINDFNIAKSILNRGDKK